MGGEVLFAVCLGVVSPLQGTVLKELSTLLRLDCDIVRLDLTSRINGESLRRKRPNYGVVKKSSGFAADDSALLERRGQHTLN